AFLAGLILPPWPQALGIDVCRGWQALRVNDDCFRPERLNVHPLGSSLHVTSMPMEGEHEGMPDVEAGRLWREHERPALGAIDRPVDDSSLSGGDRRRGRDNAERENESATKSHSDLLLLGYPSILQLFN